MRLPDKVAIITGGGRGIGKAIALALGKEGVKLVIADIDLAGAKETSRELETLGREALALEIEVSNKAQVENMVSSTLQKFGRVDILVNNAAIPAIVRPSQELSEEDWDKTMTIDLKGPFLCSQAAGRIMIAQKKGKIINMSSIAGTTGLPMRASYCAAKAGVIALTKVLATEWATYGINVNAIAPSYVRTSVVAELIKKGVFSEDDIIRRTPMRRMATPEEIAALVVFLASDESNYITGQVISIDGGWSAFGAPGEVPK